MSVQLAVPLAIVMLDVVIVAAFVFGWRGLAAVVVAAAALVIVDHAAGARLERPSTLQLHRMTWLQATRLVDRHLGYGAWLRSCSRTGSEGGWGRWFWNGGYPIDDAVRWRYLIAGVTPSRPYGSSGAGGWLQFMPGTFYSVIGAGVVRARRHGLIVPPIARSWLHPLGQAVAGIEMLAEGRRGEWAGYGC